MRLRAFSGFQFRASNPPGVEEDLRDPAQQGVGGSCKMAFAEGSHARSQGGFQAACTSQLDFHTGPCLVGPLEQFSCQDVIEWRVVNHGHFMSS